MQQQDDWQYVKTKMENEGFHYCFVHYSDFKEDIKDKRFHELRKAYLKSARLLEEYVNKKTTESEDF